jgi:integrase
MSISWENANETQEFTANTIVNSKIKAVVAGLPKSIANLFLEFPDDHNKELVADFLQASIKQENIAINTKRVYLIALAYLIRDIKKSLDVINASDLRIYLESMQKSQDEDPDQSWISTQRTMGLPLLKFYKWLAYPDMTPQERKRLPRDKFPPVLKGFVLQMKKGSKTPVKTGEIWHDEDTAVFLKYCTENPRLRFYHALAVETSGRPGELLQLRIGDINVESDVESNKMYAVLDIGRRGKKRESRIVGITDFAIQYFQTYLPYHPNPTNKEAYIFMSKEHSAFGRNLPISGDALRRDYADFRDKIIPKLLKRPDVPDKDKKHLQMLKEQKRWNPYVMRHSSLDRLARNPNVNDYVLRRHAGWSKRSNMVEVYTHDLKGDSVEHVMMAYGINLKNKRDRTMQELREELVGPHCPFCKMVNVPGTQFCVSCNRPVSTISYDKVVRDTENTREMLRGLEERMGELQIQEEEWRKRFEQLLHADSRRAIKHAIEIRKLKGEKDVKLTPEEIEDVLTQAMYDDYVYDKQEEEEYLRDQQRMYEEYLQQEEEEEEQQRRRQRRR